MHNNLCVPLALVRQIHGKQELLRCVALRCVALRAFCRPCGATRFWIASPRAARPFRSLALGYVLTAPSGPLPLRGSNSMSSAGHGLSIASPYRRSRHETRQPLRHIEIEQISSANASVVRQLKSCLRRAGRGIKGHETYISQPSVS